MEFSQDLLLGPLGALVAALGAVVWLVRTWRAEVAELRQKLLTEHEARLADARANTEAMMALNDRSHDVIRKLWEMYRQKNPPSPSKPPG